MTPVGPLGPRELRGWSIALEPIGTHHRAGLRRAGDDAEIFRFMPNSAAGDRFDAFWDETMRDAATGERMVFVVRRLHDDAVVGSTSYGNIVPMQARVEIGWTWYTKDAQGGRTNPEAKLLLMRNAFETSGYHRVELKTDSRNTRSRAAIRKLGAKEEGILRGHMWMAAGYWRDTVYYSVLADEWPQVKAGLLARLETVPAGQDPEQ